MTFDGKRFVREAQERAAVYHAALSASSINFDNEVVEALKQINDEGVSASQERYERFAGLKDKIKENGFIGLTDTFILSKPRDVGVGYCFVKRKLDENLMLVTGILKILFNDMDQSQFCRFMDGEIDIWNLSDIQIDTKGFTECGLSEYTRRSVINSAILSIIEKESW